MNPGAGLYNHASRVPPFLLQKGAFPFVLGSAGIELIFFLVAGTVLGFGFSVRIMLITL